MKASILKAIMSKLINNPWLDSLSIIARDELLSKVRVKHFKEGQRVHSKSSLADGLYCVISGEVKISTTTLNGEELVLTRILPDNWFGEIALLDGGERTHDAHTTKISEIAVIPKAAILHACNKYPEVYVALTKLLCKHTRLAFLAIENFLTFKPAQRIAKTLLYRQQSNQSSFIEIKQSELGRMVGISRQSTNKILKNWEQLGIIKRAYGGVEIIDQSRLLTSFECNDDS